MAEVVSELDKLREAAKLIEEMSQGRLQVCPSVVGQVYIRPENEAYLGLAPTGLPQRRGTGLYPAGKRSLPWAGYADQQHSRSATLSSDLLLPDATDGGGHDLRRSQDAAVRGRSDLCAANCARIKELYAHDRGSDSISGRTVGGTGSKVIPNFESDDIKGG